MLTLATLLVLGQLAFDEQPLPDVRIGPVTPFTGRPATNFLLADMNGDGAMDLLLPAYLNLQESGRYPENKRFPLPPCESAVEADIFGSTLYYREAAGLSVYSWANGAWHQDLHQSLEWPGDDLAFVPVAGKDATPVFRRFAYDVDRDGVPELAGLDAEGIHLYRLVGKEYESAGALTVFPTTVINRAGHQAIWPPEKRLVVLPEQRMSCRLLVMGNALSVITDLDGAEGRMRFRRDNIALAPDGDGNFVIASTQSFTSDELPAHVRPCRLNNDDVLDYGGAHWILSDSAPVPMPVHETWASLDGGKTFHIERAPTFNNFRPLASFVDFDSDGDQDMVVESTRFFESGLRESISQYLSRKTIPHGIRVLEQSDGTFSTKPLSCEFEIELEAPPVSPGPMLTRYESGELVNVTGDFNGDGYLDLMVRRTSGELVVRLADGWREFATEPAAVLTLPPEAQASVADLNGDGLSDILIRWEDNGAVNDIAHFAKKAAP